MWPVTGKADAPIPERSTTKTGREIWERSVAKARPDLAAAIRKTKNWRFGCVLYNHVGVGLVWVGFGCIGLGWVGLGWVWLVLIDSLPRR